MLNEHGPNPRRTLFNLSVELIEEIYLLALSPAFPHICRCIHRTVKSFSPFAHAYYILGRHPLSICHVFPSCEPELEISPTLSSALQYPIATLSVLEALYGIIMRSNVLDSETSFPIELPKRLFRSLGEPDATRDANSHPLPILRFLWEDRVGFPKPGAHSHEGYPLVQAVQAEFIPLVQFLLDHGAQPELRGYLGVKTAIGTKNLQLVKMLMEARPIRWRSRHCLLEAAVESDAQDIVKYLMEEQDCDSLIWTSRGMYITGPQKKKKRKAGPA